MARVGEDVNVKISRRVLQFAVRACHILPASRGERFLYKELLFAMIVTRQSSLFQLSLVRSGTNGLCKKSGL
jgi:hypothetical protein